MRQPLWLVLGALLLINLRTYAQVNLSQGLVMHLPLDGNANDVSGNGNNGTVYGAVPTTDASGTPNAAYLFDGVNDRIEIPPIPNVNFASYTLAAKVQPSGYFTGNCFDNMIISRGLHGNDTLMDLSFNAYRLYQFCPHPMDSNNQVFCSRGGNGQYFYGNTSGLPVQSNIIAANQNWYCVMATYNAPTQNFKLYVDGILHIDTVLTSINYSGVSSRPFLIGSYYTVNNLFYYFLKGKIDEVRVYDRALNAQEATAYCSCDTMADFTFVEDCGLDVVFTDSSTSNCTGIGDWVWDFGDGTTASGTASPVHTYATGGSYMVVLSIYDNVGNLLDSDTHTLVLPPLITVDAGPNASICAGGSTQLGATSTGTNTTYTWLAPGSVTLSDPSIANPIATPSTTTTYTLVATDTATGCSDTDDVVVTVIEGNFTLQASPAFKICPDDTVTLEVVPSSFATYIWTPTANVSPANAPMVQAFSDISTWYLVEVEDVNGCTFIDSILVEKYTRPDPSISQTLLTCSDYQFEVVKPVGTVTDWDWDFGDGAADTGVAPMHTYSANGTYVVTLTGTYGPGCSVTVKDTIEVLDIIDVNISPDDVIICPGESVQLTATGADNYRWIGTILGLNGINIDTPKASPIVTTTYQVVGSNANGCSDTDDVVVTVIDENCCVPFIPNAFTPNNDGQNDFLEIYNLDEMKYLSVKIYNRWGQVIYHAYNQLHWDGKFKGKPVDIGVYHMTVTYNCVGLGTENKEYVGEVHLIR